ncbi:MAG TPA: hypothetical protein VN176_00265 [Verrucomicrobiae bacterium]|jgi:hypothetical protein|nr:hypothetical protein [Verrucomicrobiae bacterium]
MKLNWLVTAVLAGAVVVSASAQIGIYIRTGPPANRYERRSEAPGPGYSWVEGYWTPNGNRYAWVPGRWQQPPYEGAYWNHPHYDHERQGWRMHEGHWDHEDHNNHDNHDNRDDRDKHDKHDNGRGHDRDHQR